jgi:hypothetical protein
VRLAFDTAFESTSVRLFVRDLTVRPDDLDAYLLGLLREAEPRAPAELMRAASSFVTTLGWPATLVRSRRAMAVRYDMLHFVVGALVVAEDEHALAAAAEPLRATLMSARPDFTGSCACIAELWK